MKFLVIILSSFMSICFAGVGGFVGGVNSTEAPAKYVTVEVCDDGESGTKCRTVTYKLRPPNPQPQEPLCLIGEASQEGPCPEEITEKGPHIFEILGDLLFKKSSNKIESAP